ncbi:MAG: molybdopterin molybdotransferase MoeA [Burkholderiaceae bacterium]|nr:molybdopterin molybdotransferase MoeA [Burkholderiaceae bacterium]
MSSPLRPLDDALADLLARAHPVAQCDLVPTLDACARVLARDQYATLDVPSADNTQMDGYAMRAADVPAVGTRLPVTQRIAAGHPGEPLAAGTAARIFTGAFIPPGADAVVMQEQCVAQGEFVVVNHMPQSGEWVRERGEDIRCGSTILHAGQRLSPQALGLAASVGLAELPVHRHVRVGCFFTGDELVMPGEPLPPGAIYNSNRFVLVSLLRALGCDVTDLGIVPDSLEATRQALREAGAECDLVITSGGMSVGEEDHVRPAVQAEGELHQWQIAMKPGKPLAYGLLRRALPADLDPPARPATGSTAQAASVHGALADGAGFAHFIGLPGNPVSSFVTFLLLVRPFVQRLQGLTQVTPLARTLRADFDWPKPDRRREFLRVRLNPNGGLDLFPNQSSAVLTSTVWGDGLVDTPAGTPIRRGDLVRFLAFTDLLS